LSSITEILVKDSLCSLRLFTANYEERFLDCQKTLTALSIMKVSIRITLHDFK